MSEDQRTKMLERIEEILDSDNKILDKYVELYITFLKNNAENYYLNLKKIIEYSDSNVDFEDDDLDAVAKDEIATVGLKYFHIIRDLVRVIAEDNDCPEQFYQKLYNHIFGSDLFKLSDREFGVVLFVLSMQIRELPYYQANNLLIMDNDEFAESVIEIGQQVDKGLYMANVRLHTYTEIASQLYDIAESFGNRRKAIVFLAAVMSKYKKPQSEDNE